MQSKTTTVGTFTVSLVDDGTVDIVISVNGCEHRYQGIAFVGVEDCISDMEQFQEMAEIAVEDHLDFCIGQEEPSESLLGETSPGSGRKQTT